MVPGWWVSATSGADGLRNNNQSKSITIRIIYSYFVPVSISRLAIIPGMAAENIANRSRGKLWGVYVAAAIEVFTAKFGLILRTSRAITWLAWKAVTWA